MKGMAISMEQYLQMLAESLKKKSKLLVQLIQESEHQGEIVKAAEVDWNLFDASVEKKGEFIEELNKLDDGFETLYQRIKSGLDTDRQKYKVQIQEMQKLIADVTEKSSKLMATEERNKVLVTNRFSEEKKKLKQQRMNSKAANSYYSAMNRMNYIDPQMMDHKK